MADPIVDLKRSEWDREKSKPEDGNYFFTKKIHYKNKDFKEGYIHPYKLKWCKYSEQDYPRPFQTLYDWKLKFKAELVTVGDDYWPEGHIPDAEGKYVKGDLVFVKIPIKEHMKHRKAAVALSERQVKSVKQKFKSDMKKQGTDIPDEWMEEEIDRMAKEGEFEGI